MMRSIRASVLLSSLLVIPTLTMGQAGVAINTTGAAPNQYAMLDVVSPNTNAANTFGLLIPRMTRAERVGIPTPANGLLVYQTADDIPSGDRAGLWYYDVLCGCPGAAWVRWSTGAGWEVLGNNVVAGNYLGTSDATDFVWRTGLPNNERLRILGTPGGEIGINNPTPTEALDIDGGMKLYDAASNNFTNQAGVMRFNTNPPVDYPTVHEGNTNNLATGWGRMENSFVRQLNQDYEGFTLLCGAGSAVCSNVTGSSTGPTNTPFPTSVGRGSRVQYLFRETELLASGVCHGFITEIAFNVLNDDVTGANPPATAAAINVQLRMRNVGALAAIPVYDQPTIASAVVGTLTNAVVASGWFTIPINGAGFNWVAGNNLIIEVSYTRGTTAGNSPPVQLTTGLGFVATRYGYDGTPTAGWSFNDAPPNPPAATFGTQTNRPVVRFTGQAQVPTPVIQQADYLYYSGGLYADDGNTAWTTTTYSGPGSVGAYNGVFDYDTRLTDHVFDQYFDGAIRPEDVEAAQDYVWTDLDDLKEKLRTERHLPHMPSREEWEARGGASLGDLQTGLWRTVEDQALYIAELEKDLGLLEELAFSKGMNDAQFQALVEDIRSNPRLSKEQKQALIDEFHQLKAQQENPGNKK